VSLFLPIAEVIAGESGMKLPIKHIAKMGVSFLFLFLGFQFGRDVANKVNSTGSSTPSA
jgi:hypothetical protein